MHAYTEDVFLVRNLVDQASRSWSLPEDVHDDARLVLNELAANACTRYERQVLKVWIAMPAHRTLEVGVWDPDPFTPPRIKSPTTEDETGRGLNLVATLSETWGWQPSQTTNGKVVWARMVW